MTSITHFDIKPLRRFNVIAGILHLLSMVAVLQLANSFSLPITATYMTGAPGTTFAAPVVILDTPVARTVALFLALSAFFHFLVASPRYFNRYNNSLIRNINI
jgi:hypothetical protein